MNGKKSVWVVVGFITVCIIWIAIQSRYYPEVSQDSEKKIEVCVVDTPQLSFEDSVKLWVELLNIAHPDIVLQQAKLESGNFTSKIFRENNNLFGMRGVNSRPTTQVDVSNGYGVYDNWQMSIIDYALWQAWSAKRMTRGEYIRLLGNSYAKDSTYTNKINGMVKKQQ